MNRLAQEASPYLRQHADNPVHWQPWDEAALTEARAADKPILLSIGYSACHWCHVMAHEAFSDADTAAAMNRDFVCVKVDREERPDLDRIYQLAHQLLARRAGGWPLNVFLDPHTLRPFFAGTYFPRAAGLGLPAFAELCGELATVWREQRAAVDSQNQALQAALDQLAAPAPGREPPGPQVLAEADAAWAAEADAEHGGLKGAPKFPQLALLALRLELLAREPQREEPALRASLDALVRGGLFDQLGGGFFRYCVDEAWEIPHFEKMLGDNGLGLALMADAAGHYGEARYAEAARLTGDWLLECMALPGGGFAAALDADSGGQEGRYYLWTREQLASLLETEEYGFACAWYGLEHAPNFREGAGDVGHWHLTARTPLPALAERLGVHRKHAPLLLELVRDKLKSARERRPPPGRDDKCLAGWNGLAIGGLAKAACRLNRPDFLAAAQAAADFLAANLMRDGRLLAVHCAERAYGTATLDDHAYVLWGLMQLLEAQWRDQDFGLLCALAGSLFQHHADAAAGGFFYTADDHEALIQRPKPFADDALPAGNAVAARVLLRLGHLLADPAWLAAADEVLAAGAMAMGHHPLHHASLFSLLLDRQEAPELVVLRGPAAWLPAWQVLARAGYHPQRLVLALPNEAPLPPALVERYPARKEPCAHVCRGTACEPPITELPAFTAWLDRSALGQAWA